MIINLEKWLKGEWNLYKKINDRQAEIEGSFKGKAFFKEIEAHQLTYHEEGSLEYGSHCDLATQDYLYEFPHIYEAKIFTHKKSFFHTLDLRLGFWKVEHICNRDIYKGRFKVESDHAWSIIWDIQGPRKHLMMTYHYLRKV